MLTQEELMYFKERLEEEREKLSRDIHELETPPDFGDEPGPEDDMDEAEKSYDNQAVANSYRARLAEVEEALMRITKGVYGICEKTGKEIPKDALNINPEMRFHPDYLKTKES